MSTTVAPTTDRLSGWSLILAPFLALLAAIVISASETAPSKIDVFTSPAWVTGFNLLAVAVVLVGLGLARAVSSMGLGGAWLANTSLVMVPLGLLITLVSGFAVSGIIAEGGPQITDPEMLHAALSVFEAMANGLFLLVGILLGVVMVGVARNALRDPGLLSRRVAVWGLVLGLVALGTNLVLYLISNNQPGVWDLGPYATQIAMFWTVAVGRRILKGG
ncbi:MAG: hypothetical protein ACE5F5_10690 [Acidimicrobiia bacterium]